MADAILTSRRWRATTTGFAAPAARLMSQAPEKNREAGLPGRHIGCSEPHTLRRSILASLPLSPPPILLSAIAKVPSYSGAGHRSGQGLGRTMRWMPVSCSGSLQRWRSISDRLVLSLANNHVLDQGIDGYAETRDTLRSLGIRTIGTTDHTPVTTLAIEGLAVGLVAFTDWRNGAARDFAKRSYDRPACQ